jgi:hypothetical protein
MFPRQGGDCFALGEILIERDIFRAIDDWWVVLIGGNPRDILDWFI